ncbi:MAG: hypothetical protein AB7Q81_24360 [Gammaproteobacteria bacterium]
MRKLIHVPAGRDNVHRLELSDGGTPFDLAGVTRYVLRLTASVLIDSQVETDVFDATTGGGVLLVALGGLASPPPDGDYTAVQLITFDADNPAGVVWDEELHLRFGARSLLGMGRNDLVQSLKYMLNDAATAFINNDDEDFKRQLDAAALDFGRVRPRLMRASVTLVAGTPNYAVAADVLRIVRSPWGLAELRQGKPWDDTYVGRLPRPELGPSLTGLPDDLELWLDPPPTARQVELLGATYPFEYYAAHVIGETAAATSVRAEDRHLLLLRAVAEACLELAMRGSKKPVALRSGESPGPKNGTPSFLYERIMEQFNRQARW